MYQSRTIENFVKKAEKLFPVLLLTGPRQVGKTTVLKHLSAQNRKYVTLDDPLVSSLAKEDPHLFLQRFPPPVLIDEFQYAPELLPLIKMTVDQNQIPGQYWLTGSQQFQLMRGISESLAGRAAVLNLLGFSQRELNTKSEDSHPFLPIQEQLSQRIDQEETPGLNDLYYRIWHGAFPAVALNRNFDRNLFYSSYLQTYLQRDVRDLARVGDEMAFLRFLRAGAARTGQLLNMADMARDADISPNTAKQWLSILKTSGIVYLLEPYHTNVTKRLIKAPKLYFLDTGLSTYLTEWSSPETLEAGAMSGSIFETWVVAEILKSYWHLGQRAPLYFYRDKDKKEVDLIIVQDGKLYPLEIKKTASPGKKHIQHFNVLAKLNIPIGPGGLICLASRMLPLRDQFLSIPITYL